MANQKQITYSVGTEKTEILKRVNTKLNRKINAMRSHLATISAIVLLAIVFTSCKKDIQAPERMITQSFSLVTPIQQDIRKSFDPLTWVYNYSDVRYELKLTNENNTYTQNVSVNEMIAGVITFEMIAGVYDVSYNPVCYTPFYHVLNVSINMNDVNIQGTPIQLLGDLASSLIIVDVPNAMWIADELGNTLNEPQFVHDARGFWWTYTNTAFSNYVIGKSDNTYPTFSVNPLALGKVYWFASSVNGGITIDIPDMEIIKSGI